MAIVNHAKREINAKFVYYGPPGSGKSSSLHYVYSRIKPSLRGELKSIPVGGDNLLFFDFNPSETPLPDGYLTRLHVYTLSGAVSNPATWKMTLKGADGIIILVDDNENRREEARESVFNLRNFLSAYGTGLHDVPAILQISRRESGRASVDPECVAEHLELSGLPCCSSELNSGSGVLEALAKLTKMTMVRLMEMDRSVVSELAVPAEDGGGCASELLKGGCGDMISDMGTAGSGANEPSEILVQYRDVRVEGTLLRIPLEITCGESARQLIISVSIDPE